MKQRVEPCCGGKEVRCERAEMEERKSTAKQSQMFITLTSKA